MSLYRRVRVLTQIYIWRSLPNPFFFRMVGCSADCQWAQPNWLQARPGPVLGPKPAVHSLTREIIGGILHTSHPGTEDPCGVQSPIECSLRLMNPISLWQSVYSPKSPHILGLWVLDLCDWTCTACGMWSCGVMWCLFWIEETKGI